MHSKISFLFLCCFFWGMVNASFYGPTPMELAEDAYSQGQYADAKKLLEGILDKEKRNSGAWFLLGLTENKLQNPKSALKYVSKAVQLNKSNAEYLFYKGVYLYEKGKQRRAAKHYALSIEADSSFANAWYNLAGIHSEQGNLEDAIQKISIFSELKPLDPEGHATRASYYFYAGDLRKAQSDARLCLALKPDHTEALFLLGRIHYRSKNYMEAAKFFGTITDAHPKMPDAWFNRGLAASEIPMPDVALQDFSRALDLDPKMADAWYSRGRLKSSLRMFEDAISDLKTALALSPEDAEAWFLLGRTQLETGNPTLAVEAFDRGLKYNKKDGNAWTYRGDALMRAGEPAAAKRSWRKAERLGSAKATIRLRIED